MVTKKQNQDPVAVQNVSKEAKSARDEAASIIASMANVSPEARVELQRMGLSMPALNGEGKIVVRYGYRCRHCDSIALYFVGEKFVEPDGTTSDRPSSRIPIDLIPWMQDMAPHLINRAQPMCQVPTCSQPVHLLGRCVKASLVVDVEEFIASRERAVREVETVRRNRARTGGARSTQAVSVTNAEGVSVVLEQEDPAFKDVNARLSDDAKADIRAADAAGLLSMRPIGSSHS